MQDKVVKVKVTKRGISISIPKKDIIQVAESLPELQLKVIDKDNFLQELAEELAINESFETGLTKLESLIEECIEEIFESGSDSVEGAEDN